MRAVCAAALALAALGVPAEDWRGETLRWRAAREAGLKAEGGWLSVAGLFWLREGVNAFGADPANPIALPPGSAPAKAGVFELRDGRVTAVVNGARRGLRPDSPDSLAVGRLRLSVILRGGRYGIRLRDPASKFRREFHGLRWFPPDPAWRIAARFVSQPRQLPIANVLGQTEPQASPGYAEFTVNGRPLRLYAIQEPGSSGLFFLFRDRTSGRETYGAGRFLDTEMPSQGRVVLDFNRAYNPPCAYTPYATCPLPPAENRLSTRIPAGEMSYTGH